MATAKSKKPYKAPLNPIVEHNRRSTDNPKDLIGSTKVPMSLVPPILIAEASLAFLEGKLKYGQVNWRATPVRASVYIDAAYRHLGKYVSGEDRDPLSKVHHLANAVACFGIIIDAQHFGTLIDDRPLSNGKDLLMMDELSQVVKHLQETFQAKTPKHFLISENATSNNTGHSYGRGQGLSKDAAP